MQGRRRPCLPASNRGGGWNMKSRELLGRTHSPSVRSWAQSSSTGHGDRSVLEPVFRPPALPGLESIGEAEPAHPLVGVARDFDDRRLAEITEQARISSNRSDHHSFPQIAGQ